MSLSRSTILTLVGLVLGTGVTFGGIQSLNIGQPALAQIDPSGDYSVDGNNPNTPSSNGLNNFVQPSSTGKQRSGKLKQDSLLQQLNLTPDQQQKISSVRQQYKGPLHDRRKSLKQARQELKSLQTSSTSSSSSTVQAKLQEVQRLRQSLKDLRSRQLMAMRGYLTPSQTQQLMEEIQQHKGEKKSGLRRSQSSGQMNKESFGQPNSSTY